MSYLSYTQNFQGPSEVFLRDAKRYLPFAQLLMNVMDDESRLSKIEREMIALHVSKINECIYCVGTHREVLNKLCVSLDTIAAVESGVTNDARLDAILGFASKLTQKAGEVEKSDTDVLLKAGLSEYEIEDLIVVVSLFSFLNRLLDGLGVTGSPTAYAQVGAMVAEHGYGPLAEMVKAKASR